MSEPRTDIDVLADGVRYGVGTGTSDYWRGFNDGIDRLVEAIEAEAAKTSGSPDPEATPAAEPGLDAAWAEAKRAIETWAGGAIEGVDWSPHRDAETKWAAHGYTNLGGWIGFGPTPAAALLDLAAKSSGHAARLRVPASEEERG